MAHDISTEIKDVPNIVADLPDRHHVPAHVHQAIESGMA
jgi:hypothetical protein